jgi:hypothetical protein
VVNNKEPFTKNNEIHDICTRQHLNLYQPSTTLSKYQKGLSEESDNPKKFDSILKKFLYVNYFYSLEELYRLLKS